MTIVDGHVRFDINKDPDDIRIDIDPNETIPAYIETQSQSNEGCSDGCMQGVHELLGHAHK